MQFDDAMIALIIGIVARYITQWGQTPTVAQVRDAMQRQ